ncbi:lysosomal alpha-glucosidase-like isoform X1 [Amblyomma americanum]
MLAHRVRPVSQQTRERYLGSPKASSYSSALTQEWAYLSSVVRTRRFSLLDSDLASSYTRRASKTMASATFTYFPGAVNGSKQKNGALKEGSLQLLTIPEESSSCSSSGQLKRSVREPLLCALVALLLLATLAASCAVLVYVELHYRWSFPLRVDCDLEHKGAMVDYARCLRRGCRYVAADGFLPTCFFPESYGYVKQSEELHADGSGFTAHLKRPDLPPLFGGEFIEAAVNVSFVTTTRLRLQIVPEGDEGQSIGYRSDNTNARVNGEDTQYEVLESEPGKPFGIIVRRKGNGTVIFDTTLPGTLLSEQFLQVSTRLPTSNVFGLGGFSHKKTLRQDLNWNIITFFNKRNHHKPSEYFGVHPFYLTIEEDGKASGVFLRNASPMDATIQPEKVITFRATGGVLDFDIFLGDTPDDVVRQYTELVGRPAMPPLWALGQHVSLHPSVPLSHVGPLLEGLRTAGIDVAALHLNEGFASGRVDANVLEEIRKLREELKSSDVKFLLTVDPVSPLAAGTKLPLIWNDIQEAANTQNHTFVDFTSPDAEEKWEENCRLLQEKTGFDGLILDLNEPTYPLDANGTKTRCPRHKWNNPPYVVGQYWEGGMFDNSLCGHVNQSAGIHYNLRNLYGYHHAEMTWKSLISLNPRIKGSRPMILTRATFSGSGSFGGHWIEEPQCSWESLRKAIVKAVEFSMFGVPMVGGYCHWSEEPEDARVAWLQASALFPLSIRRIKGEAEGKATSARVLNASAAALAVRKRLLPYLYTLFYEAHTTGSSVLRAPFYEFPADPYAVNVSYQFMLGGAVLVSPRVEEEGPGVNGYLPAGHWCDFYKGEATNLAQGANATLEGTNIPIHVRGGSIVPLLHITGNENPEPEALELFVAPDEKGEASGFLYWDDGITFYDDMTKAPQIRMKFSLSKEPNVSTLAMELEEDSYQGPIKPVIKAVTICNSPSPHSVVLDGKAPVRTYHNTQFKVLKLGELAMDVKKHIITIQH